MTLASIALLAVVFAALLLAHTVRVYLVARDELAAARNRERRYRAFSRESRRFLAMRGTLSEAAQLGSSVAKAPARLIRKVTPTSDKPELDSPEKP